MSLRTLLRWRMPALMLAAALAMLSACSSQRDQREVVHFWAMGYEGEVVAQLIPEFERRNPGIRVELQQLPIISAHEKLLTAFAGDCAARRRCDRQHLDLRVRAARRAGATGCAPGRTHRRLQTRRLFPRRLGYRRDRHHRLRGALVRRDAAAVLPPRPARTGRHRQAAAHLGRMEGGDGRDQAQVGPQRYATLFPLNEHEPLLNLGIQSPEPLLRDDGRYGNFRSPGFKRALAFYREVFDNKWAPLASNTQISNVWNEFGRGYFSVLRQRPLEHRRIPQAPAAGPAVDLDDDAAARASTGPVPRSPAARASWCSASRSTRTRRGSWSAICPSRRCRCASTR